MTETTTPEAAQGKPEAVCAEASATDAIVDAWFQETTSNRGLDVKVFNWLSQQRDVLKQRLAALKE